MLLPTHGSVAEYHTVSTANAPKTPHLPSFKRWLFKGSSALNDGRDIGVSVVNNPLTVLSVSDKAGFYRPSLTLSHHPFCSFFPLSLFVSLSFLFFSEMHLRHCLHSSLYRFENWFIGEALTACISQSVASVPCLPARTEKARLSSQQKKQGHFN